MKVLLKEDVENLGYAGEVHEVKPGYGRNYLIPRNLAVMATKGALKQAESWRRKAEARRAELRAEYQALAARIVEATLTFKARASESGRLYGSVTTNQIVDELNALLGTDIDRRKVTGDPLRQLGTHKVAVRLSGEFAPEVTVVIEPEGEVVPESDRIEAETEAPAEEDWEETTLVEAEA
ncbi:MAG: 50S ribosomal protein L9 [Anaerolineales bacterium]|nr:50S ribosomal protein L9 [Anaerolineales bacterium]